MDEIDMIMKKVLKEMGVDKTKPPHWVVNKDEVIDQTMRKLVREYERGYICSFCGKHSWSKKNMCDGCASTMANGLRI